MIRPQPAVWFEVLVAREDALAALEALARTGCAQFEPRELAAHDDAEAAARALREYAELAQRFRAYWPQVDLARCGRGAPQHALAAALERLRAWAREAEPLVRRLQSLETERAALADWRGIVARMGESELDLGRFARAGPATRAAALAFREPPKAPLPPELLVEHVALDDEHVILALGPPSAVDALRELGGAHQARVLALPPALGRGAAANLERLAAAAAACEAEIAALRERLAALDARHALDGALADIVRVAWSFDAVGPIGGAGILARLQGWTSDAACLEQALGAAGARGVAYLAAPAAGAAAPLVLRNPRWAQPFELFGRLLGMPDRAAVDPSVLLAFIVPLLFGYMFGDVGQGAVLVVAGLALGRRWPALRLLVAGGISAIIFGFVFGSVFSLETLLAPWWLRPTDRPLPVLMVPLFAGAALLALGLALSGLEAWWAGEVRRWLASDAGLLLAYAALIGGAFEPAAFYFAAAGALWYVAGRARRGARGAPAALGELAEKLFQLLVNTLSFVRVGAFALAHGGLSAAIATLAGATGSIAGAAAVLIVGNLFVLSLEVLVVGVQTTRLVLFEFLTRFFISSGRALQPHAPPAPTGGVPA
jgi:V/A-type H+-transporting ATPase subunit I